MEIIEEPITEDVAVEAAVRRSVERGIDLLRAELRRASAPDEVPTIARYIIEAKRAIKRAFPSADIRYFYAFDVDQESPRHYLEVTVPGDNTERLRVVEECLGTIHRFESLGLAIDIGCTETIAS